VTCVTASGQSLEIVDLVKVRLKICMFSWSWVFLVSRRFRGEPILGAHFIFRTKLVLDLGSSRCHFAFALSVRINFIQSKDSPPNFRYLTLSSQARQVQMGKVSPFQQRKLEQLIGQYPDVLREELGLTHLMEYDIQLLDKTPVSLAPYRLARQRCSICESTSKSY
jgi:hypothetical protein